MTTEGVTTRYDTLAWHDCGKQLGQALDNLRESRPSELFAHRYLILPQRVEGGQSMVQVRRFRVRNSRFEVKFHCRLLVLVLATVASHHDVRLHEQHKVCRRAESHRFLQVSEQIAPILRRTLKVQEPELRSIYLCMSVKCCWLF